MKFGKVWGSTEPILQNAVVEFHRIEAQAGFRCSTHLHRHKWNAFFVERGRMKIVVVKNDYDLIDVTILKAGESTQVRPGEKHYFEVIEDCIAFEVYWPELLSEDIVRDNVGGKNKVLLTESV